MAIVDKSYERVTVNLVVNGKDYTVDVAPFKTLQDVLREDLNFLGTKVGCEDGNCGVCTVLMDNLAVKSCCVLAPQAEGRKITTIEGLEKEDGLHPLQQAFIDYFALQCGYCTPGMILSAKAVLMENPNATEDDIREGLHGNMCRCTGYKKIVEAIEAVRDGEYKDSCGEV